MPEENRTNVKKDVHTELAKSGIIWSKNNVIVGLFGIFISILIGIKVIAPPEKRNDEKESTQTKDSTIQFIPKPNPTNEPKNFPTPIVSPNKEEIKPNTLLNDKESLTVDKNKGVKSEEFSDYINYSSSKSDIAVLVLDKSNRPLNSFSSEIANLYRSNGRTVNTSLFTNEFFNSSYLTDVMTANSKVLEKLELPSQVDYIVIAKYSNEFEPGELTTWISRANLDVSVISCTSKSQIDGFPIGVSSGHFDKQNAEKGAKEKILSAYKASHLNL